MIFYLFFIFFSWGKWEINTNRIYLQTDHPESDESVHKYRTVCVCEFVIFTLLEVFSLTQSTFWVEPVPRWQTDCRSVNFPGRLQAPVRDISGLQLMCARGAKVTTLSATDYKAWCNGIKTQILYRIVLGAVGNHKQLPKPNSSEEVEAIFLFFSFFQPVLPVNTLGLVAASTNS